MNAKLKRRFKRSILVLLILYFAGGVILYFVQDLILFHPKKLSADHQFSFTQPFKEINLLFENRNLDLIQFTTGQPRKGIVLFFHGNMQNVEHYNQYPELFTRNNYEVWMMDYPGFGKSTGTRTEEVLYSEAEEVYALALQSIHSDSIIIYGKSIGTGIAAFLAAKRKSKQLILETPYYSIASLGRHYFPIYPVSMLLKYSFPVGKYLKQIEQPVTILHGTDDEIVPYRQSKKLKEENKSVNLVTINNGSHNNLTGFPLFQSTIDSLLRN
jgi:pimeloyl-ACP methyl ester carboxylesterase